MKLLWGILGFLVFLNCDLNAQVIGSDSFGYEMEKVTFQHWVDLSETGREVISQGNETSSLAPAPEGIGAPVKLDHPFFFYGETVREIVPTVNGYLSTDLSESGADNTPACRLPESLSGNGSRIFAAHRDWILNPAATSRVLYQYFPESPHPHFEGGVSVFSWERVVPSIGQISQSFQALLFNNGDIIITIQPIGIGFGSSEMLGIQNANGTSGVGLDCDVPLTQTGSQSFLFSAPSVDVLTTPASLQTALDIVPVGGKLKAENFKVFGGGPLLISKPLTIESRPPAVVISPPQRSLLLDGVGLIIDGVHVNLIDVRFSDAPGAGIELRNGASVSLYASALLNSGGPLISANTDGEVWLSRSNLENLRSGSGDLVSMATSGSVQVFRSVLSESRKAGIAMAGGLRPDGSASSLVVSTSSFFGHQGPAINLTGVVARITNSTISTNALRGIALTDSDLALHHCTLADHGGVALLVEESDVVMSHTVIARSGEGIEIDSESSYVSQGANLHEAVFSQGALASDFIGVEARLSPLGSYGAPYVGARRSALRMPLLCHMPFFDSPVIDGGLNTDALVVEMDQLGSARSISSTGGATAGVDIGAVEVRPTTRVTTLVDQLNTPSGAQVSLREALRDTQFNGSRIVIDPSLSGGTLSISAAASSLSMVNSKTFIDASGLAEPFIISGGGTRESVLFRGNLSAHGLVFRDSLGGVCREGEICLSSCRIENISYRDRATLGIGSTPSRERPLMRDGGAFFVRRFGSFTNCHFENNTVFEPVLEWPGEGFASRGGAICASFSVEPVSLLGTTVPRALYIRACRFVANACRLNSGGVAPGPGAIDSAALKTVVEDCVFTGNQGSIGALAISAADLQRDSNDRLIFANIEADRTAQVVRSGFDGNTTLLSAGQSVTAGAMFISNSESNNFAKVESCYFYGNTIGSSDLATGSISAGALVAVGELEINHCTFDSNSVLNTNNGVVTVGAALTTRGGPRLRNSLFSNNLLDNGNTIVRDDIAVGIGGFTSLGNNLSDAITLPLNHPSDQTGVPVRLSPPLRQGDGPLYGVPFASSPAIDGGSTFARPIFDLRGAPRRQGARADIGAVETSPPVVVTTLSDEVSNNGVTSLREAIANAPPFGSIVFDPSLSGPNSEPFLVLSDSLGPLQITRGVSIDALALSQAPIILNAAGSNTLNVTGSGVEVVISGVQFRSNPDRPVEFAAIQVSPGAKLTLTNTVVADHLVPEEGAAIIVEEGSLMLENVIIANNLSEGAGSAIVGIESIVSLNFVTIAHNSSEGGGSLSFDSSSSLLVYGSVISQNEIEAESEITLQDGPLKVFQVRESLGFLAPKDSNLSPLQPGGRLPIIRPLPQSPIVDYIISFDQAQVPVSDVLGLPRRYGTGIDLGAYELGASLPEEDPVFDGDQDGMDDFWEAFYELNGNADDSAGNPDGDGFTNLEEYREGFSPRSFNEGGVINVPVTFQLLQITDQQVAVRVEGQPDARFQVEASSTLNDDSWKVVFAGTMNEEGQMDFDFERDGFPESERAFLRVVFE